MPEMFRFHPGPQNRNVTRGVEELSDSASRGRAVETAGLEPESDLKGGGVFQREWEDWEPALPAGDGME